MTTPSVTLHGFESEKELSRMVTDVDLTDSVIFGMFEKWKQGDGTRDGLQRVLDFQRGRDDGRGLLQEGTDTDPPIKKGDGVIERMIIQWMMEYGCGCREVQNKKKDLLGYCGTHGDEPRFEAYKIVVTPSTKMEVGQSR